MERTELRDYTGRLMGHREDNGDRIVLRDYTGRLVGEYIPSENTTRDHTGRAIGFGDLLGTLLR